MLAGFLFAIVVATQITNPTATAIYPVTHQMLMMAGAGFALFAIAIIIFYSGEFGVAAGDAQLIK